MREWAGIVFIVIGVGLILASPLMIWRTLRDPVGVLRPEWQDSLPAGCGYIVGFTVAGIAVGFGIWAIGWGLSQ